MSALHSLRARTALFGFASTLIAIGSQALPAAAAPEKSAPGTHTFQLVSNQDATHFLDQCPQGTPPPYVLCGYGLNEGFDSQSSTLPALNTPGITESFVSALSAEGPQDDCFWGMSNFSAVTLHTSRGSIYLKSRDHGVFCEMYAPIDASTPAKTAQLIASKSNLDLEPFVIIGGTGDFRGASGSGTITAHGTGQEPAYPARPKTGFASETYDGTITIVAQPGN